MKVLGIELKTPGTGEIVATFLSILVMSGLAAMLNKLFGDDLDVLSLIAAAAGGSVAAAHGASISKHGWRALVIALIFGGGFYGIAKIMLAIMEAS